MEKWGEIMDTGKRSFMLLNLLTAFYSNIHQTDDYVNYIIITDFLYRLIKLQNKVGILCILSKTFFLLLFSFLPPADTKNDVFMLRINAKIFKANTSSGLNMVLKMKLDIQCCLMITCENYVRTII